MKLLMDTHVFIWFISGNSKLNSYVKKLITDFRNVRFLSIASLWEMSIKSSMGKLELEMTFPELYKEHIINNSIELLPITTEHLETLKALPFHHKYPFDRLIIAQTLAENLIVLNNDSAFINYDVECLWNPS